jgi:selenocysteine lyase/cysteine desulfurase
MRSTGSPLSSTIGIDVAALRRDQFVVTREWSWLDHATFGPPPRSYTDAVKTFVDNMADASLPQGQAMWGDGLDRVRGKAARFINCETDDIAFQKSTAEASVWWRSASIGSRAMRSSRTTRPFQPTSIPG